MHTLSNETELKRWVTSALVDWQRYETPGTTPRVRTLRIQKMTGAQTENGMPVYFVWLSFTETEAGITASYIGIPPREWNMSSVRYVLSGFDASELPNAPPDPGITALATTTNPGAIPDTSPSDVPPSPLSSLTPGCLTQ